MNTEDRHINRNYEDDPEKCFSIVAVSLVNTHNILTLVNTHNILTLTVIYIAFGASDHNRYSKAISIYLLCLS